MIALLASMTGFSFRSPWLLLLALAVPIAVWIRRRRGEPALAFAPAALLVPARAGVVSQDAAVGAGGPLPRSWRTTLLPLPRLLAALATLAAIVAAARPVSSEPLPLEREGVDIVLCLDTSSSMQANDLGGGAGEARDAARTRLDVARAAAVEFVRARPHDRLGLVTFARFPDLRCPLTLDHDALESILLGVAPVAGDGPEDATGIGTAVAKAAASLKGSLATSKVVVLLTDGDENVATKTAPGEIAPTHAAQLCQRLGVRVYGIAAGAGRRSPSGAWQPLDTRALDRLAETTGGRSFRATDAAATVAAYEQIDALERTVFRTRRFVEVDRFLPWLLASLALWIAARLLAPTVLKVLP